MRLTLFYSARSRIESRTTLLLVPKITRQFELILDEFAFHLKFQELQKLGEVTSRSLRLRIGEVVMKRATWKVCNGYENLEMELAAERLTGEIPLESSRPVGRGG